MKKILGVSIILGLGIYFYQSGGEQSPSIKNDIIASKVTAKKIKANQKIVNLKTEDRSKKTDVVKVESDNKSIKEAFVNCLDYNEQSSPASMKDFLKNKVLEIEKYKQHDIVFESGEKGTLDITTEFNEKGEEVKSITLAKLDSEGLPIFLPLSEDLINNVTEAKINKLINKYNVLNKTVSKSFRDPANINNYTDITTDKSGIIELRVTENGKSLECQNDVCNCL